MIKKLSRRLAVAGAVLSLASFLALPALVGAVTVPKPNEAAENYGLGSNSNFRNVGIGQTSDVKGTIAQIINIILGFLGVVAVIIILAGGFKWMTAGGNEENVAAARKMIIQGVIGLVIIFAAWAIAAFVIGQLQNVTT